MTSHILTLEDGLNISKFLLNHNETFVKPGMADPSSINVEEKGATWQADFVTTLDIEGQKRIIDNFSTEFARLNPYVCGEEGFGGFNSEEDINKIAYNITKMSKGYAMITDPLDGTNNVTAYMKDQTLPLPRYGVMQSIFKDGEPVASFILSSDRGDVSMLMAIQGQGSYWMNPLTGNLKRIDFTPAPQDKKPNIMTVKAAWHSQYQTMIEKNLAAGAFDITQDPPKTAAVETMLFMRGDYDSSAWRWNTLWDQTQAYLLTQEAGGAAKLMDGTTFKLESFHSNGVLVATDEAMWQKSRHALIGDVDYTQCYNDKQLGTYDSGLSKDRYTKLQTAMLQYK